jgi:hypothetical protein
MASPFITVRQIAPWDVPLTRRREAGAEEWGHNSAPGLSTLDRGRTVRQRPDCLGDEAGCTGRGPARRTLLPFGRRLCP